MQLSGHPWTDRIAGTVLGRDADMRLRLTRTLLAAPLYLAWMALLAYIGRERLADASALLGLAAYSACGLPVFYVLVRSGWSRRLADPSLTLPQMGFAVSTVLLAYAVNPPVRSALLQLLALVLSFGVFALTPRQAWAWCAGEIVVVAVVMTALTWWRPERYPPGLGLLDLGITATGVCTLAALCGRTHRLRARLREQRTELQAALQRVESLAMNDALTGLPNRRFLHQALDAEFARLGRSGVGFGVVLIDIDHFKRINDRHGHAAGDWALRRFAELARGTLRAGDLLGRWGGEEFLLLLPATDAEAAASLFGRLVGRLKEPGAWAERPELRVTVSAGLSHSSAASTAHALVDRADRGLYAAKSGGRDRLVCL